MDGQEPKNDLLRAFTTKGRLLVVICMMTLPAGIYFTIEEEVFEPGFYSIFVLALPALGAALALFIVGSLVFRCLGWRVLKTNESMNDTTPNVKCGDPKEKD